MVDLRDLLLTFAGLGLFSYLRKVYKRNRRLSKTWSKVAYISVLAFFHFHAMLSLDIMLDRLLGISSYSNGLKSYKYQIFLPLTHYLAFETLYALVILLFFLISYFTLNEIVYQSRDDSLYRAGADMLGRMIANLLTQGMLLVVGYFTLGLLAFYLRDQERGLWGDDGFLLLLAGVLGGIMRYPQRLGGDWKDFYYNSAALFISLKVLLYVFTVPPTAS
jgi:hypothetical protein